MNIYIDKANLISFIKSVHDNRYDDCKRMLKNQKNNIIINCKKDTLLNSPEFSSWIRTMTDGLKSSICFSDSLFPDRPIKGNSYNSFQTDHLSALYLIDDSESDKIIKRGCILLSSVGNEVETLSKLFFNDYQFTENIEVKKLKNWDFIKTYAMPLTDIIVVDQFCLSSPEINDFNIIQLLKNLSSNVRNTVINIVIFTAKESYHSPEAKEHIKRELKKSIGCPPNVTIVLASKNNLNEHDRNIFTNYQAIDSGDTFNYFNSRYDLITKGRNLHIKSKANSDIEKSALLLIHDMQDLICTLNNDSLFIGDRKSNYLSFKNS